MGTLIGYFITLCTKVVLMNHCGTAKHRTLVSCEQTHLPSGQVPKSARLGVLSQPHESTKHRGANAHVHTAMPGPHSPPAMPDAKFAAFQRNYLTVYALMIAGDWLQAKPVPERCPQPQQAKTARPCRV